MDNKYVVTKSSQRRLRKSTLGWQLLVWWKDDSDQWVPLRIMKENYPRQVADYTVDNDISDQPVFAWWVLYT